MGRFLINKGADVNYKARVCAASLILMLLLLLIMIIRIAIVTVEMMDGFSACPEIDFFYKLQATAGSPLSPFLRPSVCLPVWMCATDVYCGSIDPMYEG